MSLIKLLKEDHNFTQTGKINDPEYKFYVVEKLSDNSFKIVSGWEYLEDAKDNLNDTIEGDPSLKSKFKVYAKVTLRSKLNLNPDDNKSWSNPSHFGKGGINEFRK